MVPKLFRCNNIPVLVNGKVDRQKLIQTYEKSLEFKATYSDEELKQQGLCNQEFYDKARFMLNSICALLGMNMWSNGIKYI